MAENLNSWECDKLFASEASGPQKNLKMGLGGNLKFCGYGESEAEAKLEEFSFQQKEIPGSSTVKLKINQN